MPIFIPPGSTPRQREFLRNRDQFYRIQANRAARAADRAERALRIASEFNVLYQPAIIHAANRDVSATNIQKVIRGYLQRKRFRPRLERHRTQLLIRRRAGHGPRSKRVSKLMGFR